MLNQLGAIDVGYENGGHERLVNFFHHVDGMFALCSDDDSIGLHQIADSAAFAEKFRIANDIELRSESIVAFDRFGYFLAGFYRNRALVDNHPVVGQDPGNFPRHLLNKTEIDAAVMLRRSRDGDEDDLRILDPFLNAAGEAQPLGRNITMDEFFESGFVNWNFACAQSFDLSGIIVDASNVMANFGKTGAGNKTDVPRTDDRNIHKVALFDERTGMLREFVLFAINFDLRHPGQS